MVTRSIYLSFFFLLVLSIDESMCRATFFFSFEIGVWTQRSQKYEQKADAQLSRPVIVRARVRVRVDACVLID